MPTIKELTEGLEVEDFFAVKDLTLRETRTGKQYARLTLGDATGALTANVWDATDELYQSLTGAGVVKVRAVVESYQNALQLKVLRIRPAEDGEYDIARLMAETPHDRDTMLDELRKIIDMLQDEDYKALIHLFLDDASFVEQFVSAPAARQNHHAYLGGLLEHTLSIMRTAHEYSGLFPALRRDLLLAGAFFHDIGKVDELQAQTSIEYTDEGMLVGHLVMGVLMIERRLANLDSFPGEKKNLLYHLILSHHGQLEYGSPILPKIPEALALHHLDNLDAKVFAAHRMITDDINPESHWTERSWMLQTKLYKG
jgi:3'-5' exoribonuclease